ncbi:MHYT domain-containing protein [Bdellovibrio bacteriovorus]|uniref:MHYT domain-containing protein n=1 Tax=Bdellovibrio bacteriovorus TaxID=959 RepID=UPI0035A6EEF4
MSLAHSYHSELVILSILVATFAAYVALDIVLRIKETLGSGMKTWLFAGAVAMGLGIWSMHFVGMLAMDMMGMTVGYDLPLSVLSVLVAIGASGLAFYIVSRPSVSFFSIVIGGLMMSVAISGMHYIGMASMRMPARIEWNYGLIALSVLIAAFASFAALGVSLRFRTTRRTTRLHVFASLLMGLAVSGMHYTGMAAATFVHDHDSRLQDDVMLLGTRALAYAVFGTTFLILVVALAASIFDRILVRQSKKADEEIRIREAQLREAQAIAHVGSWEWNLEDESISMSDEMYDILKLPKNLETLSVELILQPTENSDRERLRAAISESIKKNQPVNIDHRLSFPDGTSKYVQTRGKAQYDSDGKALKLLGTTQDITERKRIEEELRQAQMELEKRVRERTAELELSLKREKKSERNGRSGNTRKNEFPGQHEPRDPHADECHSGICRSFG